MEAGEETRLYWRYPSESLGSASDFDLLCGLCDMLMGSEIIRQEFGIEGKLSMTCLGMVEDGTGACVGDVAWAEPTTGRLS